MSNNELEREVLTRLLHAHPAGLGKEILDNYRGEKVVAQTLKDLQARNLIHGQPVTSEQDEPQITFPIKLSSAGVEQAKRLDA
ncbi:hypothetical protein NJC40_21445 [Pseudomonas sp. 21LCFQ02]|uniref:hypothetical protein n=1 Tax=unclassified Pseudomonas TaxID=196821 RepID=UPI0004F79AB1|nr:MULTISPECIES: hypothetical protein [unclassified Pseudomonas]MCO8170332.1 hypothetical protein [Pseudomonas sp. 21LCFQ02]BAP45421.1 putative uncharacterized protein [Pseudomonas sp. StFLB209]